MKRKKKIPVKKNSSKKLLNIIYFVDAQKTKSLKIPLFWFRAFVLAMVSVFVWLGAATYSVIEVYKDRQLLAEQLETALSTVFDYQTKYEGVYEEAYPGNSSKIAQNRMGEANSDSNVELADELQVEKPTTAKSKEDSKQSSKKNPKRYLVDNERAKQRAKEMVLKATESSEKPKTRSTDPLVTPSNNSDNSLRVTSKVLSGKQIKKLPVAIQNPIFTRSGGDEFSLRFDIKNMKSPERTEGYVWAVAKLLLKDKSVISLGSPKGIKLGKDDMPLNPKSLNRYSIRYYKRKTLKFQKIKTNVDRIQNVIIGILNSSGETVSYHLNVDQKWGPHSQNEGEVAYNEEELKLKVIRVASLNFKGETM